MRKTISLGYGNKSTIIEKMIDGISHMKTITFKKTISGDCSVIVQRFKVDGLKKFDVSEYVMTI